MCSIGIPFKVFAPNLIARIKKLNHLTRNRIYGMSLCAFEFIARSACNPKVVLLGKATSGERNDMIKRESDTSESFGSQTISATMIRVRGNTLAQTGNGFRPAHRGRGSFVRAGNVCPRHFNNA